MYHMIQIRNNLESWNEKDPGNSKAVRTHMVMDNLTPQERSEVEKLYNEFMDKVKEIIPDIPTPAKVKYIDYD